MKKLLLSLAALCSLGLAANAETIELNLNDATNIDGTFNEETKKDDGSVQQAARYQPLKSLDLGGFSFAFERGTYETTDKNGNTVVKDGTEPAYYYATSTNQNQQKTLRIYQGNTITITAPAGTKIASVAGAGATLYEGEGKETVTYTKTNSGTLKISTLTITTGEGGVVEPPVTDDTEMLNAVFANGKNDFTWEDGTLPQGLTYVWTLDTKNKCMKASAYVKGTNYAIDGAYLVSPELDFTGRKNITLSFSTVVNYYASVEASKEECSVHVREIGGQWSEALTIPAWPTALGWSPWVNTGEISLEAYAGKKIQVGFKYTSTAEKAGTWEVDKVLVKGEKTGSAIETVEAADADAPVEFFNLQGVRVANPENGLFIRRQGNKVEKVVIR